MGKCQDLTNQRFGELTVLKKSNKRASNGGVYWTCQCTCGKIKDILGQSLKNGKTISCGHVGKEKLKLGQGLNFQDLTGKTFGELTVLSRELNKNKKVYWKCLCSCGNSTTVMADNLRNGNTQSCGLCREKSHGNIKIKSILNEYRIPYEREKRFGTCRDKISLPFDFYVDNKYLIEYDGKQHFQSDLLYSSFQLNKHDKIKSQWCKENNIPLIRIPFTHYDKITINDLLLETSPFIEK